MLLPLEQGFTLRILALGIDALEFLYHDLAVLAERFVNHADLLTLCHYRQVPVAAICETRPNGQLRKLCNRVESMSQMLEKALAPETAERCWGKGAAFAIAMENARKIVSG